MHSSKSRINFENFVVFLYSEVNIVCFFPNNSAVEIGLHVFLATRVNRYKKGKMVRINSCSKKEKWARLFRERKSYWLFFGTHLNVDRAYLSCFFEETES